MSESSFRFKQFTVHQDRCAMKVGTDGILLGAWASAVEPCCCLDIGTGTGLIALMLAQRFPAAFVDAVECESQAAQLAGENFRNSPWSDRLNLVEGRIQAFAPLKTYDLIVSNPPWFRRSLISGTAVKTLARHDESLPTHELFQAVHRLLTPSGTFCLIAPADDEEHLMTVAREQGLFPTRTCDVIPRPGRPAGRVLMAFESHAVASGVVRETLIVETDVRHQYTEEFRQLTRDFYLRF
jgi:tRNA1Val (adenine37-N6)-methyltransferase